MLLKGFKVLPMNIKGSVLTSFRLTLAFYQLRVCKAAWGMMQPTYIIWDRTYIEVVSQLQQVPKWGSHALYTAFSTTRSFGEVTFLHLHFQMMYQVTEPVNTEHEPHQNTLLQIDAKYFSEQTGPVKQTQISFTQQSSSTAVWKYLK